MKKPAKDPIREDRIHNEAIVDAYGPEEQAMGWYYYLENKIRFPFQAKCIATKVVSPLRKGETVEVRGLAPEDACAIDILVQIRWQGRKIAVPLSQLAAIAQANQPRKPSAIGITGSRKATFFERTAVTQPCREVVPAGSVRGNGVRILRAGVVDVLERGRKRK
jgi:Calcium binding